MTDDFAEYPKSITEARAEKSANAADWTPRDVLIDTLRRMDSGDLTDVDALVIGWRRTTGYGITRSSYAASGPDIHTSLGILEYVKFLMLRSINL